MKMNSLGRTGLMVSELCLGTMTWGTQTGEADAHQQIDTALAAGVNIIDTAEMYPTTPLAPETMGRTEEILGTWNAANPARRGDYLLATKISGAGQSAIREGAPSSAATVPVAVEASLKRLQTDYIDLYQLHWPNRGTYSFRRNWDYDPTGQDTEAVLDNMAETLEALDREVKRGTIRHVGLSNETAWGTMRWLRLAEERNWPRVQSIQNEYSLLCRLYDTDLAELSHHEDVGLLAFSPLAVGLLTGKYQYGNVPEGSRRSIGPELSGRFTTRVQGAVDAYLAIAQRHGLHPVHMALAWCGTRPFMASAIFGAATQAQLETALGAADVTLSEAVLAEIAQAHRTHPMPY
ncbi:MAG: aldo/keto reductase [Paracoccaceae bacterium]